MERKIRSGLIVVSFLIYTPMVWAQDSVRFHHQWQQGEHRDFVLSRLRQDYMYDTLYSTTGFNYDVSMSVSKAEEEETEITWVYKSKSKEHKVFKKTPDKFVIANALEYLTLKLYGFPSLKVVYSIDATGAFLELKNKEEVRSYIATIIKTAQHERAVTPDFKGVLEQFKPTFLSDDFVEYTFLSEIQLYHQVYGMAWKMGKQQEEIELPNPLTGLSLPGTLSTEVKKMPVKTVNGKKEAPAYDLTVQQQIDKEKLTEAISEKIDDTYEKIDKQNDPTAEIDFSVLAKYSIKGDVVKKASYTKTVVSAESKSVEEYIIK